MADEFASVDKNEVMKRFLRKNRNNFKKFIKNSLDLDISNINSKSDTVSLLVILKVLADNPDHEDFKKIIPLVIQIFVTFFASIDDNRSYYKIWYAFCETIAGVILKIDTNEIAKYLKPFYDNIHSIDCEVIFNEFVYA
jgi:hypothetical protein